jgi:hypothetical protein
LNIGAVAAATTLPPVLPPPPPAMPMPPQSGTIWTVAPSGGQFTTFEAAVGAASSGDTIQIASGAYTGSNLVINKSLTIVGTGAVTINYGSGIGPYIQLAGDGTNVAFENLTLAGTGVNTAILGDNQYGGIQAGAGQTTHLINVNITANSGGSSIFAWKPTASYDIQGGSYCPMLLTGTQISVTPYNGVGTVFTDNCNTPIAPYVIGIGPGPYQSQGPAYVTINGASFPANSSAAAMCFDINTNGQYIYPYVSLVNETYTPRTAPFAVLCRTSANVSSQLPPVPAYFSVSGSITFTSLIAPTPGPSNDAAHWLAL